MSARTRFLTVTTDDDGRVCSLDGHGDRPDLPDTVRATVWELQPGRTKAVKVLDALVSDRYAEDDPHWDAAARSAQGFHRSEEFATLRRIEAHLIQAGHVRARTAVVSVQCWGVELPGDVDDHYLIADRRGWRLLADDPAEAGGWLDRGVIAPLGLAPEEIAAIAHAHLAPAAG